MYLKNIQALIGNVKTKEDIMKEINKRKISIEIEKKRDWDEL